MLPSLKQRVWVVLAVVAGAWCWLSAGAALQRADMGAGISLLHAKGGWGSAVGWLVVAGLPAVGLSGVVSGAAHPLAGVFSVGMALAVVATAGGSIEGLLRQAAGPGVYAALAGELVIWAVLWIGVLTWIARSRLWVRRRFPKLTTEHHFGAATRLRWPDGAALAAGVICAAIGSLACWVLIRASDPGQVLGGLMLGFMLAALLTHQVLAQPNPIPVVLSPLLTAAGGYLYVGFKLASFEAMMLAMNNGSLAALARVLPIQYASAGVAGCVLGLTLAQAIEQARDPAAEAA